jgi:D-methionine transport system ATP-binding protein
MFHKQNQQPPIISLKSVSLSTPITNCFLLENISFDVEKGQILGVLGGSGAGKSTLFRLLNRLIDPSEGSIYFNNQNLKTIPSISLRQQVVLVPQEPKLLGMKAKQALTYPLQLLKLTPTEIKSRLSTWITKLRLSEELLERTELQLSLGQRQLVAIARALIMQPQVLLLDEPTSALDIGKAHFLLEILRALAQNNNTTILMISHQLDFLKNYAHRVVYLEKGRLMEENLAAEMNWQKIGDNLRQSQLDGSSDDF